jgi:hypothetical protein
MKEKFLSYPKWLKANEGHVDINRSDKDDLIPDGLTNTRRWVQSPGEQAVSDAAFRASDSWKKKQ